jgi:hypothetical protein
MGVDLMSKVTLLNNADMINKKYKMIDKISKEVFNDDILQLSSKVLSETILAQYDMMRAHLNKNSIRKRFFSEDLKNMDLINAYYGHMYSHNHIAFEDEVFETYDAYKSLAKLIQDPVKNEEKIKLKKILVLEELIDIYHFLIEYTCIMKEHLHMIFEYETRKRQGYDLTLDDMTKFLTTDYNFGSEILDNNEVYNIFYSLDMEGRHIASDIFSRDFDTVFNVELDRTNITEALMTLLYYNREFVRITNFKDWKNYPESYYNLIKFAELNTILRKLYKIYFEIFSWFNLFASELIRDMNFKHSNEVSFVDTLKIIYTIYMAKRTENIRRQQNDPRYTGKKEGEVVGIDT